MKILFFSDNFPPERNAAASRVFERALHWVKWGHQVSVLTSYPNFPEGKIYPGFNNKLKSIENLSGIRVIRVVTYMAANRGVVRRLLDFLSFMLSSFVAALFMREEFDVIVATSPQFFTAVSAWLVAKIKNIPFVMEVSDLWPESISAVGAMKSSWGLKALEWLELKMYKDAKRVVVLTNAFKKNLVLRGIDPAKVDVVINGVDLKQFQPKIKSNQILEQFGWKDKFIVGYIGTHGLAHDLENVLLAAEILDAKTVKDQPQIHFMFMGPGAAREALIQKAKSLNLSNISFVDPRPKNEVPDFWSCVDLALVHLKDTPLFSTVIPSKIFEAMAMAKPILLVAPEGEASEIVKSAEAGWLCEPANPKILAEKIKEIASSGEGLSRVSERSKLAASHYSREQQAQSFISTLNQSL